MDASLLQPLFVDCSVEYDLDMTRFPGWDDPVARAQPTLMLLYPELPCDNTCPSVEGELQKLSSTEEEYQALLQEFIVSEEDLQSLVQDFCHSIKSTEDDLPSIIDEVFGYADMLLTMTGAVSPSAGDHAQSPETFESATQTDNNFIPETPTSIDFLSDSYVSGPMSPGYFSSIDTLSSTPASECDTEFLLHSQELHHSCRKRQISDDSDQPSAKRLCNHDDEYYNALVSTFITDSSENEMCYGFSGCDRD